MCVLLQHMHYTQNSCLVGSTFKHRCKGLSWTTDWLTREIYSTPLTSFLGSKINTVTAEGKQVGLLNFGFPHLRIDFSICFSLGSVLDLEGSYFVTIAIFLKTCLLSLYSKFGTEDKIAFSRINKYYGVYHLICDEEFLQEQIVGSGTGVSTHKQLRGITYEGLYTWDIIFEAFDSGKSELVL